IRQGRRPGQLRLPWGDRYPDAASLSRGEAGGDRRDDAAGPDRRAGRAGAGGRLPGLGRGLLHHRTEHLGGRRTDHAVIRSRTCRKNPPHSGPEGRIRVSVDYNPYDPATIENPYPAYQRLREEAGVHHLEELGLWAVPRYDDVLHVLRDPKLFSSEDGWGTIFKQVLGRDYIYGQGEGRNIIATDPPVHSRIRRTVNRAFTPKLVQSWGQGIRSVASGLLDDLEAKAQDGPVDIVEEYFSLLPV